MMKSVKFDASFSSAFALLTFIKLISPITHTLVATVPASQSPESYLVTPEESRRQLSAAFHNDGSVSAWPSKQSWADAGAPKV